MKKHWSFRKPDERKAENRRTPLCTAFCKRMGKSFVALGTASDTFQQVKDLAKSKGYNRVKMGAILAKLD
jgi:hypothetical protein